MNNGETVKSGAEMVASRSRRWLVSSVVALPLAVSASAGWRAFAQDAGQSLIDSVSRKPFVAFLARDDTFPGHTFICMGVELDNGMLYYERLFGFYPSVGGVKVVKAAIHAGGELDFAWEDMAWSVEYRVGISEAQKLLAQAVFDKWQSEQPAYNLFALGGKNCSVLAKEIATAIGLKLPPDNPGATFPANYIRKLKTTN
jgi:hypothetical protein